MSAENVTGSGRLSNGAARSLSSPTHLSSAVDNSVMSGLNIRDTQVTHNDSMKLETEVVLPAPCQAPGPREATSPAPLPKSSLARVAREAAQLGATELASDLGLTRPASQASLLSDLRSASVLCEAPEVAPGTLDLSVIKSSQTNGPLPSQEVDASARTAFSGIMGHTNAISDERSSIGGLCVRQSDGAGAGSLASRPAPTSSPSLEITEVKEDSFPTRVVCETKTVNQPNYDIPCPREDKAASAAKEDDENDSRSFNPVTEAVPVSAVAASTYQTSETAMSSLSACKPIPPVARRGGWRLPCPGLGLRGGAPLPGETSALSNGTSGWGPPPSNSGGGGSGTSGWGNAPAVANPNSSWGNPQQNINNGDGGNQQNSKMLNTLPGGQGASGMTSQASQGLMTQGLSQASQGLMTQGSSQASQGLITQGQSLVSQSGQTPGPAAVQGSTSWAAAAGKGLPPSENTSNNSGTNGTTNKQLEQLNSVREALFSQDGWGCQHVKQDTSWDVAAGGAGAAAANPSSGGSGGQDQPPSAAAAVPGGPMPGPPAVTPKVESMQWTPPGSSGRNDGTDLWRSTLSGVPAPVKPQPQTPWGNHTPAHPADYKNWGDPEDGGGPGDQNMPGERGPGPEAGSMWNSGAPGSGPGSSGSGGATGGPQPWDSQARDGDRGQFDDRDRQNWGGKPKDEMGGGWSSASNQWGPGPTGPGAANNGGSGGWGPPPSGPKGNPSWGGAGSGLGGPPGGPGGAPGQGPRGGAPQWEEQSPTMARRFDDGGTSLWGGGGSKSAMPGGPPGGWKDMPVPNSLNRGPPGGPRMPPGPGGVKPEASSPWGQPQPGNRGWGEADNTGTGGWGGLEDNKPRGGGDGGMWGGGDKSWGGGGAGGRGVQQMPGMRNSPSWDDGPGGPGMMGDRANTGGWGGAGARPNVGKDMWGTKPFRILCEMGFRKEDVETALRQTNMQLDDALEMLNAHNRGGMPGGGNRGMPPSDGFGPRGEPDYGMRFPGPGPMPYPPGSGDMPGAGNLGGVNPSRPGNLGNPNLGGMNGGHNMQAPPRPQPSGQPSTAQLRVLVQQIQMAVQAGHLNPQILNQPLAPQTLFLLNQLLQQIKQLQNFQQQHHMAQAQAGQRPGTNQQQALMGLTVQITKHKQQIQNLQNQITAQQAQYLMNQQGGPKPNNSDSGVDLSLNMGGLGITDNGAGASAAPGGSKLLQMINKDNGEFSRAPGAKNSASSPNLLLDNGPWSNGGGNSGWPDSSDNKAVNLSGTTENSDTDNFGIPEFVPGKAWKGTAQMKDPTEDPTMTPGSVASSAIGSAPLSASDKTVGTASSGQSQGSEAGLSNSTWSLATPASNKEAGTKDSWALPSSSSSNTLTEMGQNLWGPSRPQSSKQQTPTTSLSTWPSSNGLNSTSGGWSNGSTSTTTSYLGTIGQTGSVSAWLLLKNLTAQIDGSTLRTLCLQHGPLTNFHLYLTHGIALVKYSNGLEAKKAQNALNNCVLGNTTILAATAEESEVESIIRQLSQHNTGAPGYSSGPAPSTIGKSQSSGASGSDTWGSSLAASSSSSSGLGWPSSSSLSSGSVWGAPGPDTGSDTHHRTTPLNSFLPPDLLSEGL